MPSTASKKHRVSDDIANRTFAILDPMSIQIQLEKYSFAPGEKLGGLVSWAFDKVPPLLTLELAWETTGKGSTDGETVHSEEWKPDSPKGSKAFSFQLPRGPISVQSKLISIQWNLECSSKRPESSALASIVISHMERVVRLESVSE